MMRLMKAAVLAGCIAGLAGCGTWWKVRPAVTDRGSRRAQTMMLEAPLDAQTRNAVISQHTLFPYHFIPNAASLNELGVRDLGIIAEHFADYPGPLSVRQGDFPADLYEARLAVVEEFLERAGVDVERVRVEDTLPGGAGMSSEWVVRALQKAQQSEGAGPGAGDGAAKKSGTGSGSANPTTGARK